MDDDHWRPFQRRPEGLRRPLRVDPTGRAGPTRAAARSSRWRRVAHGWYVEEDGRPDVVEQRILEQAVRVPATGAVTAWAALRWVGAGFFDGTKDGGRTVLPVPVVMGRHGNLRPNDNLAISWEQFAPWERRVVAGLPCAAPARALFDEVRRRNAVRPGVVAVDMACAAGLITAGEFGEYVATRPAWTGVPLVRKVLPLVDPRSMSPQESLLRLVWVIDAGLPTPLCNQDLLSPEGAFLGRPDLFCPEVGLVGEYDGADHLREDRRSHDRAREERFRDHGLEYVSVVRGELNRPGQVARRLRAAYYRALDTPRIQRWQLPGGIAPSDPHQNGPQNQPYC